MIGLDTSVIVRYLVGTPAAQAKRAARLIDDDDMECGVSPVALAECAHVLRTKYEIDEADIIDGLIGFIQRETSAFSDSGPMCWSACSCGRAACPDARSRTP